MNAPQSLLALGILIATSIMVFVTITSDEYRAGSESVEIDLTRVAGHTEAEVAKVFGESGVKAGIPYAFSDDTGAIDQLPVWSYREGDVNVAYRNGRAVWLSIDLIDAGESDVPFTPEAVLDLLDLDATPPTRSRNGVFMVWHNLGGYRQIWAQSYPPDGGTGYVTVTL